jgi:hypothetical protein
MNMLHVCGTVAISLIIGNQLSAAGLQFAPGDVLITRDNSVFEYSPSGTLMGSLEVPRPSGTRWELGGVAVDGEGRLHVHDLGGPGTQQFYLDYLSTFDPSSKTWIHTVLPSEGPDNGSDQDIAVKDNFIYFNTQRVDIHTRQVLTDAPFFGHETAEIVAGLDGYLYSTTRYFSDPNGRSWVFQYDPTTFATLGSVQLKDQAGNPIDIRGLAVRSDGDLFAVSWVPSFIYHYNSQGGLINALDITLPQLNDLHLRPDGLLVASQGYFEVTDTSLTASQLIATVGTTRGYATFVPVPESSSTSLAVAMIAVCIARRYR